MLQIVGMLNPASAYKTPGCSSCEHLVPSTKTMSTSAYIWSHTQQYLLIVGEVSMSLSRYPLRRVMIQLTSSVAGADPAVIAGRLLSDKIEYRL
jgi:hypothetical protein